MSLRHLLLCVSLFFFKEKTAYDMRMSDWGSDVCSSDLCGGARWGVVGHAQFYLGCRMRRNGFTLIELLVALVIFAMLAGAGVLLLGNSVAAQGQVRERLDELASIQRVRGALRDRKSTRLHSSH